MYGDKELSTLPKDVRNSLKKIERLLAIVEENYHKGKDYTIVELIGEFGTLERVRKIFDLYYFSDSIGISKYISEIRKSKLKNIAPSIPLINMDSINSNIISIYDNMKKLDENGYVKIDIKRTNINVTRRNDKFLREILTMREYVYPEEVNDIEQLINYNLFLENYEYMDEQIRASSNYNPNFIMDSFVNRQNKFEHDEKHMRMAEFLICYDKYATFKIQDLVYYTVDRSKYKSEIEKFKLPDELNNYVSICKKTNYAVKLLSSKSICWYFYVDDFKRKIHNILEKETFLYIVEMEDQCMEKTLKDIYQHLKERKKGLKKVHIENALKSLIIKGFVSLRR